jgi:superfamily II DNA or RNA helicase
MPEFEEELSMSLLTGFVNNSTSSPVKYQPELLLNDKGKNKKVLYSLINEFRHCETFFLAVAFATKGGIASLLSTLEELELKGVRGKILLSQYLNFTQPEALRALLQFRNIELRIITEENFHSKGYIFQRKNLFNVIIGSSNLTANALSANTELNLKFSATQQSKIIQQSLKEYESQFAKGMIVDENYIKEYEKLYKEQKAINLEPKSTINNGAEVEITPNSMQQNALNNLAKLRAQGIKKSLLISATGTGKTYLAALDAHQFKAKKVLFIVHRANIAKKALATFEKIFGPTYSAGLFSGNSKERKADLTFCTVQTLTKTKHLQSFPSDYFDYIIIDETHRAGAATYRNILEHFSPDFLLGMTATPERTDGFDIFKLFNHNIAYEIRLKDAMEADLLCPFHYFGVTDLSINAASVDDKSDFNLLVADERVERIIEKIELYGCDDGEPRGLIFCSQVRECNELSKLFNKRGFKTISLSGGNSENEREVAIERLETDNPLLKIDYIFTVDIFNEGIDIPRVNQIIMLRPTQSAIIFVQQLGRGLRKLIHKDHLTVIDFIGNYQNNYLVPIALYGDTSFNKDNIRKLLAAGSSFIPGTSTVNFDEISKKQIFNSINNAKMDAKRALREDYNSLKYKIGRVPMMLDYLKHGSRDPYSFVSSCKSYFNFVEEEEPTGSLQLSTLEKKLLELFANEINNAKRIEEVFILRRLILKGNCSTYTASEEFLKQYGYTPSRATMNSAINNLNFNFVTERQNGKTKCVGDIYGLRIVDIRGDNISLGSTIKSAIENKIFLKFLNDNIDYALKLFGDRFAGSLFCNGFGRFQKYSRKDVFRILNWDKNPNPQSVGGYMVNPKQTDCAIFVNYDKEEDISDTTKYPDRFLSHEIFLWMSKNRRNMSSPDIVAIKNSVGTMRLPLFIKKNNDEGLDFYYIGELEPLSDGFEETRMDTSDGKGVSVVQVTFKLDEPVNDVMFNYITDKD